jgi:hypothetical protein
VPRGAGGEPETSCKRLQNRLHGAEKMGSCSKSPDRSDRLPSPPPSRILSHESENWDEAILSYKESSAAMRSNRPGRKSCWSWPTAISVFRHQEALDAEGLRFAQKSFLEANACMLPKAAWRKNYGRVTEVVPITLVPSCCGRTSPSPRTMSRTRAFLERAVKKCPARTSQARHRPPKGRRTGSSKVGGSGKSCSRI